MHFNLVAMPSTFDASTVNGGAIDGFLHPLLALGHLFALLMIGFFCAQINERRALVTLGSCIASILVGALLGVAGVQLPLAAPAMVVSFALLAVCVVLVQRIPWQVGLALAVWFGLFYANSHAIELGFRSATYQGSFLLTFATASIGLIWVGLAIGFLAGRSRMGMPALRVASMGALAITLFTLLLGAGGSA